MWVENGISTFVKTDVSFYINVTVQTMESLLLNNSKFTP